MARTTPQHVQPLQPGQATVGKGQCDRRIERWNRRDNGRRHLRAAPWCRIEPEQFLAWRKMLCAWKSPIPVAQTNDGRHMVLRRR